MAATASCMAKWTVAISRNGDPPGARPAVLIACIADKLQSDTTSAWALETKPRHKTAVKLMSFDIRFIVVFSSLRVYSSRRSKTKRLPARSDRRAECERSLDGPGRTGAKTRGVTAPDEQVSHSGLVADSG